MEKTPIKKSLKFVRSTDNSNPSCSKSEEMNKQKSLWESEICSQENTVDVEWDWNSPKNIKPKIQYKQRRQLRKSPKASMPKKSQLFQTKDFEKLRDDLQALKNEIAKVDEDNCLVISPNDEQTVKEERTNKCEEMDRFIEQQYHQVENSVEESCNKLDTKDGECDDMFNDSWDEKLLECTQILEEKLRKEPTLIESKIPEINIENYTENTIKKNKFEEINCCADDSFDAVLKEFKDEDIEILTQKSLAPRKIENKNTSFKRTFSDANVQYIPKKDREVKTAKFTFHRTHSFESASTSQEENMPKHIINEIERKRREALEKLRQKKERNLLPRTESNSSISPIKCSPEEIEQKRLQAKAIREAKQKEMIEKNRLEALRRLEMNRKKKLKK